MSKSRFIHRRIGRVDMVTRAGGLIGIDSRKIFSSCERCGMVSDNATETACDLPIEHCKLHNLGSSVRGSRMAMTTSVSAAVLVYT